jgi:hypothetical protein
MRNGNTTILGKRTTKAVQTYKAKLLAWSPNYLDSERVLVLMLYAFEEGYFFGANAARNPTIFP